MRRKSTLAQVFCLPLAAVLAGCSASHYRKSADAEAYRLIREKSGAVQNMDPAFALSVTNWVGLEAFPVRTNTPAFLGPGAEVERGARVVSLDGALRVAIERGRVYQTRREQLYLAALDLGFARHQWTPLFTGNVNADYAVTTDQALAVVPDPAAPGQFKTILSDNLVETHKVPAGGSVNAGWLIRDVGRLTTAFSTTFLRTLTGGAAHGRQQPVGSHDHASPAAKRLLQAGNGESQAG
jgi:hypothetical protein